MELSWPDLLSLYTVRVAQGLRTPSLNIHTMAIGGPFAWKLFSRELHNCLKSSLVTTTPLP